MFRRLFISIAVSMATCSVAMATEVESEASTVNQIREMLSEKVGGNVFVKPLEGTELFIVAIGDSTLFTDKAGSVLINGDVLALNQNIIVSDVVKEEFAALRRKQAVEEAARIEGVDVFIKSSSFNSERNINETSSAKTHIAKVAKERPKKEPNIAATPSVPLTTPVLVQGYTKERVEKERACLAKIEGANDLETLYARHKAMNEDDQIFCGQVFAGNAVDNYLDEKLIVYKSPQEKARVTILSDYTCAYCQSEHLQIPYFLEQGITVRIYPYTRHPFMVERDGAAELSTFGKNMLATQCSTSDNETKKKLFDTLVSNSKLYETTTLKEVESLDLSSECARDAIRQQYFGDIYTAVGTPLHVFSNGLVHRGYLKSHELIEKALAL